MPSYSKKFQIPGKLADAIYSAVSMDIERFLSKTPLSGAEIKCDKVARTVSFKSPMASGVLSANDGELALEASLSLLATPFKGKIEEGIARWLGKTFDVKS